MGFLTSILIHRVLLMSGLQEKDVTPTVNRISASCLEFLLEIITGNPSQVHFEINTKGWPILAANAYPDVSLSTNPVSGSAGLPVPGYDVQVIVIDGETDGNLVVKLPLPPGCCLTLWQNHSGYIKSYLERFPGFFDLSDIGKIDENGYIHVMGRSDDVLNVAGHRLSTGAMEEAISQHPKVAECAVVALSDKFKGSVPIGFVVLKMGITEVGISKELIQNIRQGVGAMSCYSKTYFVSRLPKTRSGKSLFYLH
jgi:propionyl-CoA synthetase